jgi:peptidoglycan/xylan/chitin deacetylase (PgdA/CDA1 family)
VRTLVSRSLRRAVTRTRARFGARGVILLYHRVARPPRDPWGLSVAPERFDGHMALLRRRYRPLSLTELVSAMRDGTRLPPRTVCVTFDDGYGDVARDGLASLERHGVPATLFAVSGAVGGLREFWWDEAERLTLDSGPLPATLAFQVEGREQLLEVPPSARAPAGRDVDARAWRAWTDEHPTPRHALYHALWSRLQPLRAPDRTRALDTLREQVGDDGEPRRAQLPCTLEELRGFQRSAQGTVGAHTVTHPELSALAPAEQAREIGDARRELQALLATPVALFSYPFGHLHSYTADSERLVREAGFEAACLNSGAAPVRTGVTDPMRLPRLYVNDWNADVLAWHIDSALGG